MGDYPWAACRMEGFMIRERMKMMGNIGFDDFFEINVFWNYVHDWSPDTSLRHAFARGENFRSGN